MRKERSGNGQYQNVSLSDKKNQQMREKIFHFINGSNTQMRKQRPQSRMYRYIAYCKYSVKTFQKKKSINSYL